MNNFFDVISDPERLSLLQLTALLNSPAEDAFDRFTQLASDILDVPVCLVNLVDVQGVFSKSRTENLDSEHEHLLDHCCCRHVVTTGKILAIEDAVKEPLFRAHSAITEWGLRAYIGIPLRISNSHVLGTLCVIDRQPRAWTSKQIEILENIAAAVITEIELRLETGKTAAANTRAAVAEEQFQGLIEQATVGIAQIDLAGRFLLANQCYCNIAGRPMRELLQLSIQDIMPVECLPANLLLFGTAVTEQPVFTAEKRYVRPDGSEIWVNISISSVTDSTGKPYSMVAVMQDITERKRVELTLRQSQQQLSGIFSQTTAGIAEVNLTGQFVFVNQRFCEIVDRSMAEILRLGFLDIIYREDLADNKILFKQLADGAPGYTVENRLMRADGSLVWVSKSVSAVTDEYGKPQYIAAVIVDISDRKRAEEELRQSEEFSKRVIESSQDCIKILDLNGILLYISPHGQSLLEISNPASCLNSPWTEFWSGADQELAHAAIAEARAGRVGNFQGFFITERGTPTWWDVTITPILDPKDNIERLLVVSRNITEKKRAQDAVTEAKEQLQLITDTVPALISYIDNDGYYRFNNRAYETWFGYPLDQVTGRHISEVLGKAAWTTIQPHIEATSAGRTVSYQSKIPYKNRGERWISATYTPHIGKEGDIRGTVVHVNDITAQKNMEEAIRASAERFRFLAESMPQKIFTTRPNGDVDYVNPQWVDFSGLPFDELRDSGWARFLHADDVDETLRRWMHSLETAEPFEVEHRFLDLHGIYRWHLTRILALRDAAGKVLLWVGSNTDIDDFKQAENTLRHSASHDSLTGCPNKALFLGLLESAISRAQRRSDYSFAVLFLDLDRFKNVNDSLGHLMGDQLLVSVAQRLSLSVRAGDTLARFGGDEFTILLEDVKDISEAVQVAERIKEMLSTPFDLGGHQVYTTVSIGITLNSADLVKTEDILRDADIAMYRAKALGRSGYEIFNKDMHADTLKLWELESDLRRAMERQELLLHYQPIVSLDTGEIIAVEALARWQHPQRGLLPPSEFIPLAEEIGLVCSISERLLKIACAQLKIWQCAGYPELKMAVNCSALQFEDKNLVGLIKTVLNDTNVQTHSLVLEITETLAMKYQEENMVVLRELDDMGVELAIDDFGTGYSSLFYLKRFPIKSIKVDRSFVKDMAYNKDDAEICAAIIAMAHKLGLKVVAEGVETEVQLNMLRNLNCNEIQGFMFSKPLDAHALTDLLRQEKFLAGALLTKEKKSL